MILYQIAKSMEERERLSRSIRESRGNDDVAELMEEKTELEQAVLSQAMKWKEADPPAFA